MVRYSRSLVVLSVTAALAVPATLSAQTAIPRPTSSGSSGSSSGSSGSSGGGSTSSGSGSTGESRTSPPPMPSFPTDSRRPSSTSSSSGSSRSGSSATRGGSSSGDGDGYVGPGTTRTGSAVTRGGTSAGAGAGDSYVGSRSRGGRPITGGALERRFAPPSPNYNLYFPYDPFSPWGRWYPWYYGGFGYGYVSFDPWRYGTSRYSLYRYGAWYNPYDPWCYGVGYWLCDPWGGAATTQYGASAQGRDETEDEEPSASVRLRVSPSSAKVYVDGVLVGTASDFSGLTGHLKLTGVDRILELRADGYETLIPKISLEAGKTVTVRATLKKQ